MPEGAHQCAGASYQTCVDGQWVTAVDCPNACADGIGCVQCSPGTVFCDPVSGNPVQCDQNGTPGMTVQMCMGQNTCVNGACVDACNDAATSRSYIACEYWAVDLSNAVEIIGPYSTTFGCSIYPYSGLVQKNVDACVKATNPGRGSWAGGCDPGNTCQAGYTCTTAQAGCVLDAQHSPFAVVVSNPQVRDVHVTLTGAGGQTITQTIAAGAVLPILPQAGNAMPDASLHWSGKGKLAYELTADLPVVAYQFNPLDNSNVFSNDASLLIPRTTFDTDYYVMAWPTLDRRNPPNPLPRNWASTNSYFGYVVVVAWQDNTTIEVTPTAPVQASATQTTIAAGATTTFTLNAFETLELDGAMNASTAPVGGDLTGTLIHSTNGNTFGVFGGHDASAFGETTPPDSMHTSGPCCADHLEEMLFPKSTWGKEFAIARSQQRTNEPDYLRVMAQKPNTAVTFTPAPSATVAGNCGSLQPGTFCDVKIQGDTEVVSTEPILIGHYLESSIWGGNTGSVGNGDPSMAIAVPTEQYRTDYTILIPMSYTASYLSISAAATGAVTVDGTSVTLATFPGGGTHRVARVPVAAGQHTIHCPDSCGVLVYGYSDSVSYMFAGGLDLKQIVIQ